ncbi:MAG: hypothetical protein LW825_04025 [Candidatus Jidaibacter sp.]|jgi:hypothetical protein|nr:hypothetical protein [Candidatus Jidaibacter sp.]
MFEVIEKLNFQSREMEVFEDVVIEYIESDHISSVLECLLSLADEEKISGYKIPLDNSIVIVNLAGLALFLGKEGFATCILQCRPKLLFQTSCLQGGRFYSVLDIAVNKMQKNFITKILYSSEFSGAKVLCDIEFAYVMRAYEQAALLYFNTCVLTDVQKDIIALFMQKSQELLREGAQNGNNRMLQIIGDARCTMSSYAQGEGYPVTLLNFISGLNELEDRFRENYKASTSSWVDLELVGAGAMIVGGLLVFGALLSGDRNHFDR